MHGSSAVEKGGFAYILSKKDHPAASMMANYRKMPTGTVTTIGLTKEVFDRSAITFEPCIGVNKTFEDQFGYPATRQNCQMYYFMNFLKNCSINSYYGLPKSSKYRIITQKL